MSRKHGADNGSGEREQGVGGGGLKDVRRDTLAWYVGIRAGIGSADVLR